jgi:RNA polymerase sigma-70 factor (family 1)
MNSHEKIQKSVREINEDVIKKISKGEEKSFSLLYDCYYTYLNTIALYYVFNKDAANEIVNDVFINVWNKRSTLLYPIHSYLIQSVKNGCLNYIRSQQANNHVKEEYKKRLLDFREEYILSDSTLLQQVEMKEVEKEIGDAIAKLPEKCRNIFEQYMFSGKLVDDIAKECGVSVSTVRVQIKNAMDKLKISLSHLIVTLLFILLIG